MTCKTVTGSVHGPQVCVDANAHFAIESQIVISAYTTQTAVASFALDCT